MGQLIKIRYRSHSLSVIYCKWERYKFNEPTHKKKRIKSEKLLYQYDVLVIRLRLINSYDRPVSACYYEVISTYHNSPVLSHVYV